jgi:hypothetical protein
VSAYERSPNVHCIRIRLASTEREIQVIFNASGNQLHHEQLAIDVEDRSPEIHPQGVLIELDGESCIPGINANDVEGIFEEHAIKKEIDLPCTHGTVYGVTDKVGTCTLELHVMDLILVCNSILTTSATAQVKQVYHRRCSFSGTFWLIWLGQARRHAVFVHN